MYKGGLVSADFFII